ncbi:MAG: hypothetical protein C0483_12665 [Pirellula sp.]|nr:hypothetical protein [Pirellula sp.]
MPPQPCTLLVVDEDADFLETVTRRFMRRGFTVQRAASAAEVSVPVDERRHSIVLIRLAASTAQQLEMLKDSGTLSPNCQVVALATREQLENALESIPEGISDCFAKPLIWGELDWRIFKAQQRFLQLRQAEANGAESARGNFVSTHTAAAAVAGGNSAGPAQNADTLAKVQRAHILEVLQREGGNKARTARALGVNRRSLYRLIEKFQIAMSTTASDS